MGGGGIGVPPGVVKTMCTQLGGGGGGIGLVGLVLVYTARWYAAVQGMYVTSELLAPRSPGSGTNKWMVG